MIEIIPIQSVVIIVHTIENEQLEFMLEAPNSNDPFQFSAEEYSIRPDYRDKNMVLRKGVRLFDVHWSYDYVSHEMDLRELLMAEKITLKAPPNFYGEYSEYETRLMNSDAVKNYLRGLAMAGHTGNLNPVPSGGLTLEFGLLEPLTWEQLLSIQWTQDFIDLQPPPPENFTVSVLGVNNATIFTTSDAGNSQSGNTFILNVGINPIFIDAMEFSLLGNTDFVRVYYREGPPVYSQDGGWILHGEHQFTGNNNSEVDQKFDFESPLFLDNGKQYSFFVVRSNSTNEMRYTNGNQSINGDGDVEFVSDRGVNSETFGSTFADRIWNGRIYYRY